MSDAAVRSASSAFGDGPSGFSFDASLYAPTTPSSRSTSSIGLPGVYGTSRSMFGGTSPSAFGCFILLRPRIAAEDLHEIARLRKLGQRGFYVRVLGVTVEIDEEHIFPRPLSRRPRFDLGKIDLVVGEGRQHLEQHA